MRPARELASLVLLMAGMGLASCATNKIEVSAGGAVAPAVKPAGEYVFAPAVDAVEQTIQGLAETRLRAAGFVRGGSEARYLVEVAYDGRPPHVGAYGPQPASGAVKAPDWFAAPARRALWTPQRARICTVAIRFSQAATGEQLYWVRAAMRRPRPDCMSVAPRLLDAAFSAAGLSSSVANAKSPGDS